MPTPIPTPVPTPVPTPTPLPTPVPTPTPTQTGPDVANGQAIFLDQNCDNCHEISSNERNIWAGVDPNAIQTAITDIDRMSAYRSDIHGNGTVFTDQELIDMAAYIDIIVNPVLIDDPAALFSYSVQGYNLTLDASSTVTFTANPHSYEWSVNNGLTSSGIMADLMFDTEGVYEVSLTVTDDVTGSFDSITQSVEIVAPSSSSICDLDNAAQCFDFENGLPATLSANASTYEVDTSIGYMSDASVRVDTQNFSNGGFFKLAPPANDFWARVFLRSSGDRAGTAFGGDSQGFARAHGVILRGEDGGHHLRIGDHRCQLEINRDGDGEYAYLSDDLEMTSGSYGEDASVCMEEFGARMAPETWYCLEVHFNGDDNEVQVFWDNQNVQQLHVTNDRTWTNADKAPGGAYSMTSDQPWGPYTFDYFSFGYESFNNLNSAPNISFWFDGVATSTQRIGCGDDYVINETLHSSTELGPDDNGYPYDGTSPTPTPSPSPTPAPGPSPSPTPSGDYIIEEDFEAGTVDGEPAGWDLFVGYNLNPTYNPGLYESIINVVDDRAYSGTKSLHISSDSAPVQVSKALPAGLDTLYVRSYVYQERQMGNNASGNHETLIALRNDAGNVNTEVRFGEIKGAIGTNHVPSDDIAPSQSEWYSGPSVSPNEWHCIEVAFLNSGTESQLYGWVDDTLVHSIEDTSAFNNGLNDAKWMDGMFNNIVFGWHSFSSEANELWFDDIAVSETRIGCD